LEGVEHRDDQVPTGGKDAHELGNGRRKIGDVGESETAHDESEVSVLSRDAPQIGPVEHRRRDGGSGSHQHLGGDVDTHHVMAELHEAAGMASSTACRVERGTGRSSLDARPHLGLLEKHDRVAWLVVAL
jgi:hypothetical protein